MKAAPKKETARIQLPPDPKPLPKATVRMAQTQPLAAAPAASITKAAVSQAPAHAAGDGGNVPLAAAAAVVSVIAFVVQLLAYLSA
jgi:hypothetical protein